MDRLGVAERATFGHLDGIDVADEVGDGGVGGGELLGVALVAVPPHDGQLVAELGGAATRLRGDRGVRVLAQLGAVDDGRPLVEQADDGTQEAGLALAALAEQHDVVTGDQGAFELREHGRAEPDDAGPGIAPLAEGGEEVRADLVLHSAQFVTGRAERAEGAG